MIRLRLINLVFPNICALCRRDIAFDNVYKICGECYSALPLIAESCKQCSKPLDSGGAYCYECRHEYYYFNSIVSPLAYEGIVKELVYKFKYFRRDYLRKLFVRLMLESFRNKYSKPVIDFIVPVPMHWSRELIRGYNQTVLLADELSKELGHPRADFLRKTRLNLSQAKLTKDKRIKNTAGAFGFVNDSKIKEKNILLVDDVATTASTLNECSKILKKNGAKNIFCLTLARD